MGVEFMFLVVSINGFSKALETVYLMNVIMTNLLNNLRVLEQNQEQNNFK